MIWGVGVVALLGLVAWLFRTPGSAPLGRAFGVLAGYGLLFWLTLLKVWWTAGLPAVEVDGEGSPISRSTPSGHAACPGSGCWPAARGPAPSRYGWW